MMKFFLVVVICVVFFLSFIDFFGKSLKYGELMLIVYFFEFCLILIIGVLGLESFVFDIFGEGFYIGLFDG